MANQLSPELFAQIYGAQSDDPFLTLVTLSHASFPDDIRLVNNSDNITSRGALFLAFPVKIRLPVDDGETNREVAIEFDNVSLDLIDEIRNVTSGERITVKLEMILASIPDEVQISLEELFILSVSYNKSRISARLGLDSFLNTELSSERFNPSNFPGLF